MKNEGLDKSFNWRNIRLVVFDVDGTLYDQNCLRKAMLSKLFRYYLVRPWRVKEIAIIASFRTVRENIALQEVIGNIDKIQFEQTAISLGVSVDSVRNCVSKWIYQEPLPLLKKNRYPHLVEFCLALKYYSIQFAAFSDYPAGSKISALGLPDMPVFCSTESSIDVFKPNPRGLLKILEVFRLPPSACLLIGDRDDRDGECARRALVSYLQKTRKKKERVEFESYGALLDGLVSAMDGL